MDGGPCGEDLAKRHDFSKGQANNVSKAGSKYLDYRRRFVQLYLAHEAVAAKWKLHMPDPIVNTGLPPGL